MSDNNFKGHRKAIIEFLRTGKSQEGKNYFEQWFFRLTTDKQLDLYQSDEDEEILKDRIRKAIERKIEISRLYNTNRIKNNQRLLQRSPVLLWAASITVLIGIVSVFYFYLGSKTDTVTQTTEVAYKMSKASFGEKRRLTLQDGTVVFLNSGSEFRYPVSFLNKKREVYLTGEAFFQVSKDKSRPFIVNSGDVQTIVLGTSFNVRAFQEQPDVSVTVVSGKVKVGLASDSDSIAKAVMITKNLEARYSKADQQLTHYKTDAMETVLWKDNVLNFNNQSLSEIAVILERWFNVEIIIEDKGLNDYSYVGKHNNPTLYHILEALHFSTAIEYEIRDNTVILKSGQSKTDVVEKQKNSLFKNN